MNWKRDLWVEEGKLQINHENNLVFNLRNLELNVKNK